MRTITIDDRESVLNVMDRLLKKVDRDGEHITTTDPYEVIDYVKNKYFDVAFLDVEMPKMNGIELANKIQGIEPLINIVFITGYKEYMPEAFKMYASGYLMKPIGEEDVRKALINLRHKGESITEDRPIRIQCFGNFEVFIDNLPVAFQRKKTKELLGYLIDRKGAICTNDMIIGNLWPDRELSDSLKSMVRTLKVDLIRTFRGKGYDNLIVNENGGMSVNLNYIDCDYYKYLRGDPNALRQFRGEYMSQYDFAEETREALVNTYFYD